MYMYIDMYVYMYTWHLYFEGLELDSRALLNAATTPPSRASSTSPDRLYLWHPLIIKCSVASVSVRSLAVRTLLLSSEPHAARLSTVPRRDI